MEKKQAKLSQFFKLPDKPHKEPMYEPDMPHKEPIYEPHEEPKPRNNDIDSVDSGSFHSGSTPTYARIAEALLGLKVHHKAGGPVLL